MAQAPATNTMDRPVRSTRYKLDYKHSSFLQETLEVNKDEATVIARYMQEYSLMQVQVKRVKDEFNGFNAGYGKAIKAMSFIEMYTLKQGLKKFGEKGYESAYGEMDQLHQRNTFQPIHPDKMTRPEWKKVLESIVFLIQKRDGRVKARTVANGSVQRGWMTKEEAASPTAAVESILMTAVIDAKEGRCVATVDIPNAFIQTPIGNDKDGDRITMKVKGPLVDMLLKIDYELYHDKVVYEKGDKVLYMVVQRAIYGMIQSALMFYQKLRKDLEEYGFKVNKYDPCVANKMVNGKQLTVTWHVDDLNPSHKDEKVIDEFIEWLGKKYGDNGINKLKATKGTQHEYLGMILDYSIKGKVRVDMMYYVDKMLKEFPEELKENVSTPASDKLFEVTESPQLSNKKKEVFHAFTAKSLFLGKSDRKYTIKVYIL